MYRRKPGVLQVFLVHPGGPFWVRKDLGVWSIPKGELDTDEDPLAAAKREFEEETGCRLSGEFIPLSPVKLKSGKTVLAWASEGDCDASGIRSNTFTMEWPPKSGSMKEFSEVDRAGWFALEEAEAKINTGQAGLLRELRKIVDSGQGSH